MYPLLAPAPRGLRPPASDLARRVGCCRQREAEARTAEGRLVVRLDLSAMRFDDGSGNGKSHAHAAVVGREKTLKELREMIRLDARTAIFQRAAQGISASEHGSNRELATSGCRVRHGLHRIDPQIYDHLLEL